MTGDLPAALAFAAAVEELVRGYRVAPQQPMIAITVAGPSGEHRVDVPAGTVAWLTSLVLDEMATARSAHAGEDNACAHCGGTGAARR